MDSTCINLSLKSEKNYLDNKQTVVVLFLKTLFFFLFIIVRVCQLQPFNNRLCILFDGSQNVIWYHRSFMDNLKLSRMPIENCFLFHNIFTVQTLQEDGD